MIKIRFTGARGTGKTHVMGILRRALVDAGYAYIEENHAHHEMRVCLTDPSTVNEALKRLDPEYSAAKVGRWVYREAVRAIPCSECGAAAGLKCVGVKGQLRPSNHIARWRAYRDGT